MNLDQFSKLFPLGSHLCREPMPAMSELKRDMELLKSKGFNLIKLQEHWACDEAAPGHYDFACYEELIEHAGTLDMGVYLGLTCEQAPAWLYRKHPGCRMVGRDGTVIAYEAQFTLPADGKPGPCLDDPGALADEKRFITSLVQTLGRYENVVVWNTWQEIGYWSQHFVGHDVCFCPNTLASYRTWLKTRYSDLDALNCAWKTRYSDWKDVSPNRSNGNKGPYPNDITWQYFMDNVQVGKVLKARCEAIKTADPLGRPVFAHKGGPAIGYGQDWTYARCQDFLGTSSYPQWVGMNRWDDDKPAPGKPLDSAAAQLVEMQDLAMNSDYIRSANGQGKQAWAAEFQGGPLSIGLHVGKKPSPEDIRRWMLTSIGSGMTAVSFWVTRAEISAGEINGFSLLDSEGDSTPRFEEAARIGSALQAHPELFREPTRPAAKVAILINEWNAQLCAAIPPAIEHLTFSTRGWHRLLWKSGIAVDFIEASELNDRASDYRAIIAPFPLSISEEIATQLVRYVHQGGHLISEACPGRIDENGYCPRGELSPALRVLFGVSQESLSMVREPDNGQRWFTEEHTSGDYLDATVLEGIGPLAGGKVRANLYLQTFTCQGSDPCLMYGNRVAGVVRCYGQGDAWLIGTYLGHSATAYRDDRIDATARGLFKQCGLVPEHAGRLLLRRRCTDNKEAWLFTNPTKETVTETVDVSGWTVATDLFGNPIPRDGDVIKVSASGLDVVGVVVSR